MADQEIVYGQGLPTVVDPNMTSFDQITEDIKYKAQLLARETKLSSGVLATVSMGFGIGFIIAIVMMLAPFALTGGV
ncbi:MAG: Tetrahydromethanopterin S-methyltransferase subunit F [Methanosaeta sp. PtaB.Bin039]|nr:MAG: Tetrahydromethanopterin S-methyltransferase subunit F [Methanosaeta sp. PtaB.Bin039]OPY45113.1 MAG: Tetrahydromethanopterin S-methyltransferase subunit F [Methanosaeta sp. PtaU1.Bin028]HOT07760.1 tetrahydromethanopterin S-methyltransferase subunit F [Methanotrichaceae archaeon]HQF16025.1 tetrahydromethanopterin S-methyltransferase subunit F [Methanotrichaceae archaeon]HQI90859.1 tetrahydromethanopterin S-methyltransferase subunit F [Methanotrichaceae archaeon]